MAPVRLHVLAQGGDFKRNPVHNKRDRAVLNARWYRLEAGGLCARNRHVRQGGRGQIDLVHRLAQQGVAHGAADDARLLAVAIERQHHAAQARLVKKKRVGQESVDDARCHK